MSYASYFMVGMAYLWPWNSMINATAYFQDRLHSSPFLRDHCIPLIMIVATLTSITTATCLARTHVTSHTVVLGLVAITAVFIVLAVSCTHPSPASAPYALFLLAVTAASHWGSTMAQSGSFATANASHSPLNIQALMVGQAVAGVVPSVSAVLTAWTGGTQAPNMYSVYFLATSCISALALALWLYGKGESLQQRQQLPSSPPPPSPNTEIFDFRVLRVPISAIFLSFAVSLCFPVFAGATLPVSQSIPRAVFIPLAFLLWNVGDLMGRLACAVPALVVHSCHVQYALSRVIFIPYFCLFNIKNRDPIIASDHIYLISQLVFGFTGGHLSSSVLMCAPRFAAPKDASHVGSVMTLALSLGLASGSVLAYVLAGSL